MGQASAPERPRLVALALSDPPAAWQALGFRVRCTGVELGGVRLALGTAGEGIRRWSLAGVAARGAIDGLPTEVVDPDDPAGDVAELPPPAGEPARGGAGQHPNGATGLDHVVVVTPDFDRTATALAAAGLSLRRIRHVGEGRDAFRQGFRRLGPAILELVETRRAPAGPARFWGLVANVADLDALCARLGPELVSEPRAAVQPGRRIATLRRPAGLAQAVAFMSPEP